jgi:hypothetical protein
MSDCEYIRNTYGVPAQVGGRVIYDDKQGTIRGATNHLVVQMDGEKKHVRLHPTWEIAYLADDGSVLRDFRSAKEEEAQK